MKEIRLVHYVNQFFGGVGGEDQAGTAPMLRAGPVGPGRALEQAMGPGARIVATMICGDNFFAERRDEAMAQVREWLAAEQPDVVVAGPAFSSGRYGLACAGVCEAAAGLGLPVIAGLYPENPGVEMARKLAYVVGTGENASSMRAAMARIAPLAGALGRGEDPGSPEAGGYLPRGIRRNVFADQTAAERAVAQLLAKLRGEPFETEIPLPQYDRVTPPAPIELGKALVALSSEAGIVPRGNPDRIESVRATRWRRYTMAGGVSPDVYQTVHGGFNNDPINADPLRAVPLDAARASAGAGGIGRLHEEFWSFCGAMMPIAQSEKTGRELAVDLKQAGVQAVILTAT